MPAIAIRAVTVAFAGTTVLDRIDLEVEAGELFFLLGASGCGKTTLLRTVAGFQRPDAGSVSFGGQEVTALPPERRGLGMVFQNYALWPHLDVAGNVAFGLEVQGVGGAERARRVDEALALVELSGLGARRIGELSGGQQQRVALARALVVRPRLLLLDEPLSNLDPRLRVAMRREIRRICKAAAVTALYVTHDQDEALATADRIALLAGGRVEQVGTPRQLYERPASELVAGFVGEANLLDRAQASAVAGAVPAGERFCLRPERVHLGAAGSPGVIIEGSYEGACARWRVRVEGVELLASEPSPPERAVGDAVLVAIDPADLVPLPVRSR
jgi:iron(III) transport system ATP-binding protein